MIGSGAGGVTTAITRSRAGPNVIVVEKAPVFGAAKVFSGGVQWVPGNKCRRDQNASDTVEVAPTCPQVEAGNHSIRRRSIPIRTPGPRRSTSWNARRR
ncbi:MAG: FAD-binding protein [Alphaproteobacteria bacterium]|nr:FAD-binding protein [Alphaproteobacteria bacterium]